ncbi:rhomboid family intramembrane serine protease [Microbulbifer sp. 2205BS26-8]|uniref:rhomboid family intramembrane serine protease n=1 Tax=Microbulbifer sp. 2205BS26-8 TaxID=3064386 RepID=UPI00273FF056|nr:rhomboid family intramembrane serine protease [Microbulbifer sp. 2205BS26-8]MDP5210450.1 rhomboid family intramembrane serine protease [Microbulbifer sp. 2205BS26-8]
MSQWIAVYSFPLSKDLGALVGFIQRYQLPLRIVEEKNRQLLLTVDDHLGQILKPLLQRWEAGEISFDEVQLQRVAPGDRSGPGETRVQPPQAPESGPENRTGHKPVGSQPASPVLPFFPLVRTPVSLVLIALCFLGWVLLANHSADALLITPDHSGSPLSVHSSLALHLQRGEYWRLITPAMVHFSLAHALFNALGIWILGRPLEARAGSLAFIALVVLGAVISNVSQYLWEPQVRFGGMSGVVYALVGAVVVIQRWQPAWRDVPYGIPAVALIWLLLCALGIVTFFTGVGVANAAHIGGFLNGLVIALVYCALGGARKFNPDATVARKL